MDIKDILKQRRIALGLTQDDVAKHVGVSETTVSRWESGEIDDMKRSRIVALAEVLQISPAVVMGWKDSTEDSSRFPNGLSATLEHLRRSPGRRTMFSLTKNVDEKKLGEINRVIEAMIGDEDASK